MHAKTLIASPIAGHLVLLTGMLTYSVWDIQRLASDRRSEIAIGVPLPPPPLKESGGLELPKQERTPKDQVAEEGADCGGPGGIEEPTPEAEPSPSSMPKFVLPRIFRGMQIRGETAIWLPHAVEQSMLRDGRASVKSALKVCITSIGTIASVKVVHSTRYPAYDKELTTCVRQWRYRPYMFDGVPVRACSTVTFLYQMKWPGLDRPSRDALDDEAARMEKYTGVVPYRVVSSDRGTRDRRSRRSAP